VTFRPDLYRGTALAYARHRPPYPRPLIDHIIRTAVVSPPGRLLDLACGPGPLAIALRDHFAETWAVDSEPDMIAVARTRAPGIRFIKSAAEDLSAPAAAFDLITIGNAFHRMPRDVVAARARRWLRPGGYLVLAWGGSPWPFEQHREPWQDVLREATAPRGAVLYRPRSGQRWEELSLDLMAYPVPKG
jgi:ubiquinone/menaquinone biosynthesis C-methylase UbiE